MLGLAEVLNALLSVVTMHVLSPIQPSVFRLSLLILANMLSVKQGDNSSPLFLPAPVYIVSLSHPLCQIPGVSFFRSDWCSHTTRMQVASHHNIWLGWAVPSWLSLVFACQSLMDVLTVALMASICRA